MRLIECDLHTSQQSIAMPDRDTGVVVVGIEATGSMGWFLLEDLDAVDGASRPASAPLAPSSVHSYPTKRLGGGRTWWAHFEFTRINIEPTILRKKIEDLRETCARVLSATAFPVMRKRSGPMRMHTPLMRR